MNKNNVFFDFVNLKFYPEFVYILGFLWADGSVDNYGYHHKVKAEIVSDDAKPLTKIFLKTGRWYSSKRQRVPDDFKKSPRESTTFKISNKEFVEFLIKFRYKSKNLSPQPLLDIIPKKLHNFWFRGLIDGDGSFHCNGRRTAIIVCGPLEQDWSFLKLTCEELKIAYNIYKQITPKGSGSVFKIQRRNDVFRFGSWLYEDSALICLPRKFAKFKEIVASEQIPIKRKYLGRPIKQLSLGGLLIKKWPSASAAGRGTGICNSYISSAIRGKVVSACGFKWELDS